GQEGGTDYVVMSGGAGNDTLISGRGADLLSGNAGADTFVFDKPLGNSDSITDFAAGQDTIQLDALVMSALGASGRMAAGDGRFYAADFANSGHDADDRIIYNTSNGALWYDADGNGSGAAQRIATLQNFAGLTAADIVIVNG